jgi:hypothetical protein
VSFTTKKEVHKFAIGKQTSKMNEKNYQTRFALQRYWGTRTRSLMAWVAKCFSLRDQRVLQHNPQLLVSKLHQL